MILSWPMFHYCPNIQAAEAEACLAEQDYLAALNLNWEEEFAVDIFNMAHERLLKARDFLRDANLATYQIGDFYE